MIQKKKKELSPEEAFSRLASYCAYAEHSAQEVRKKCQGWELSDKVCDALIEGSGKALLVQVALLLQALDEGVAYLVGDLPASTLLAHLLDGMLSVGAVGGEA